MLTVEEITKNSGSISNFARKVQSENGKYVLPQMTQENSSTP